jgi:integrase/recombinase XerD
MERHRAHSKTGLDQRLARLVRAPKVAGKLVPVIADDELAAMPATCKGGGFENRRDYAIIALFKDTGILLAELAGIALADVDVRDRQAIVTGKGDKQRTVRFTHGTARALDRYLRDRARHRNGDRPRSGSESAAR